MNDRAILFRLMWKDFVTINPLLIVTAIVIVAANLFAYVLYSVNHPANVERYFSFALFLLVVMPNLVALGAPAMLVGNEEEAGTLAWQRTLPVDWRQIAQSKFLVGLAGLVGAWLVAIGVFMLLAAAWHDLPRWNIRNELNSSTTLSMGFFSISLLLLSFVFIYLIRAPLPAMLWLIPGYVLYIIVMSVFWPLDDSGRGVNWTSVFVCGGSLLVLWVCQQRLARRRLWLPIRNVSFSNAAQPSAYRPLVLRAESRPTPISSLLWQQIRQAGPACAILVVISTVLALLVWMVEISQVQRFGPLHVLAGLSPLIILLSASWLGAVVFYGDNVHQRCAFLADRGISPAWIWWTRMVPPLAGFVVTWLLIGLLSLSVTSNTWFRLGSDGFVNVLILAAVMFSFGQLVSQWTERPLMAFLAAPAYTLISLMPLLLLIDELRSDFAVVALTIPVLFVATRRLTGRWLEGQVKSGYTLRVLGYTAIAVLIPSLWVVGHWSYRFTRVHRMVTSREFVRVIDRDVMEPAAIEVSEVP